MKKALLVFALVAFLATGTVFAEITGVGEPTVSGTISATFGYDLDSEASGFDNDNSIDVKLPLLDGSATKGGEDEIYGMISVDKIGWVLQADSGSGEFYDKDEDSDDFADLDASVSAKIVAYDFYVDLGSPDFEIQNVDVSNDYRIDAHTFLDEADTWKNGIAVGFANDLVGVEFKIGSKQDGYLGDKDDDLSVEDGYDSVFDNDMDDDVDDDYTANVDNDYVFGATLTLTPMEGVSVPVSFIYDDTYSADSLLGIGAAPSVALGMVTVDVPFDFVSLGDASGFEVEPSVAYTLTEAGGSNVTARFLYGSYTDVAVAADVDDGSDKDAGEAYSKTFAASTPENAIMEAGLIFTETETKGFVPGMAATLEVALTNMADYEDVDADMGWTADATASYNMDGLKPYVGGGYGDDEVLDMNVGLEMAAAFTGIDNTTLTLDYTVDDLTDKNADPDFDEKGRITFDATITW